jgi:Transposase IS66 family
VGEAKQLHRLTHSKPLVDRFFDWVDRQFERQGFTPSHLFVKALAYARERRLGLEVFLTDLDIPPDTNHLERALRVIPMGRNYPRFVIMEGCLELRLHRRRKNRCRGPAVLERNGIDLMLLPGLSARRTMHNDRKAIEEITMRMSITIARIAVRGPSRVRDPRTSLESRR